MANQESTSTESDPQCVEHTIGDSLPRVGGFGSHRLIGERLTVFLCNIHHDQPVRGTLAKASRLEKSGFRLKTRILRDYCHSKKVDFSWFANGLADSPSWSGGASATVQLLSDRPTSLWWFPRLVGPARGPQIAPQVRQDRRGHLFACVGRIRGTILALEFTAL